MRRSASPWHERRTRTRRPQTTPEGRRVPRCAKAPGAFGRKTSLSGILRVGGRTKVGEHVAGAAPRVDEGPPCTGVELSAQPPNVYLERIGKWVVILVPDVRGDVGAAHDLTSVSGEKLEHRVFARSERNRAAGARRGLTARVDREVTDLDRLREHRVATSEQGAQTGKEFIELEWLR